MALTIWIVLAVKFGVEVVSLVSIGIWAYGLAELSWMRWALAVGVPGAIAVVWASFINPRGDLALPLAPRLLLEFAAFGLAVYVTWLRSPLLATILAGVVVLDMALLVALGQYKT